MPHNKQAKKASVKDEAYEMTKDEALSLFVSLYCASNATHRIYDGYSMRYPISRVIEMAKGDGVTEWNDAGLVVESLMGDALKRPTKKGSAAAKKAWVTIQRNEREKVEAFSKPIAIRRPLITSQDRR